MNIAPSQLSIFSEPNSFLQNIFNLKTLTACFEGRHQSFIILNCCLIRHNKKDGAVSIRETIFCEFWSIATTVKKIFDKSCNFIDIDTSFA